MRTLALALLVILASLVAGFLWLPAVGTPSSDALEYSLMRASGGAILEGAARCRERGRERWTCRVPDRQGSGSATYRLRMEDTRCWQARKVSPDRREEGRPLDRRVSDCVMWRDQLRLFGEL